MHSGHLRREDRTDRSGVDAAVGVATDLSVDGADIEAGAASDAPQGLGGHLFGQEFGTTIVDQDDVYFVGDHHRRVKPPDPKRESGSN